MRWGLSVMPRPLFTPGKTRYPLYRRLGGPQGRTGQVRKISPPPGFDPRTVQPIASRYTDWVTRYTVFKYSTHYYFQILIILKYYRHTSQNIQISSFTKIRPVGAELFHADRRTDMTKLTARFHDFANAPKQLIQLLISNYILYFIKQSLCRQLVPLALILLMWRIGWAHNNARK